MDIILEPQEETVQVLIRLGLTCNQARVYVALVRLGMSTAKTMSKVSEVAREDIYRIIPKLQEVGLVEKRIDAPSVYAAIPIRDAFTILLKNRNQLTSELEAKTKELSRKFKKNKMTSLEEETNEFILIPDERAVTKRKMMIDDAKKRLDFIVTWERLTLLNTLYVSNLRNALKRNVEVRIIVGKPKDEKSLIELTQVWREKYPFFRARWIPNLPEALFMLADEKKVLFAKLATTNLEEIPFLWSANQSLVSVVQGFFEKRWLTSSDIRT